MDRRRGCGVPASSDRLFFSNRNLAGGGFAKWLAGAHGELQAFAPADVVNKRRSEADQTASAVSPDTRIKDAVGLAGYQVRREGLRLDVALGNGAGAEIF